MRVYSKEQNLMEVICNGCGKHLRVEQGILKEGCCTVEQSFGYFSDKDGMMEKFDLCEECYQKITDQFKIPVEQEEINELL